MALISVIIPVYQVENELPFCLESLLAQSFHDWEGILVDDGSTDQSAAVCRRYVEADSRFSYHYQKNAGISATRNTGICLAGGQYLFFLDSDDTLPDFTLELLYNSAMNTGAQIVCGQMQSCYSRQPELKKGVGSPVTFSEGAVKENLFHPLLNLSSCGKLYVASILEGITFPINKRFEDAFTVPLLIYKAERITLLPDFVYFYWQRAGSITHSKCADYYTDWIEAFSDCEKLVAQSCPSILPLAHSRYIQSYLRVLDLLLCWPHFRKNQAYGSCRSFVVKHLGEFLSDPYLRTARKLYALGVCALPDLISLFLQHRRKKQERACKCK